MRVVDKSTSKAVLQVFWFTRFVQLLFTMDSQEQARSIYGCMLDGDEIVEKIKPRSLFLVGESKVGKSTLFNYLLGYQLTAVKNAQKKYVYSIANSQGAQVKPGYTSATLCPNISPTIQYNGNMIDVSVQDMAGYKDAGRSYVGVFGVSYMLKVALQKAKSSRFILTVEDAKMQITQVRDIVGTFQNFVNMLVPQYLIDHPDIARSLFNSVALVITKASDESDSYLSIIEDIIAEMEKMERSHINVLTEQLLRSIYDNKRVQVFEKASNHAVPVSNIYESLSEDSKNWSYFDFQAPGQSPDLIIKLPFKEDYKLITSPQEKEEFEKADQKKTRCISAIMQALQELLAQGTNKWFEKGQLDFSRHFKTMQEIFNEHNDYGDYQRIQRHIRLQGNIANKGAVRGMDLFKKVIQIMNNYEDILKELLSETSKEKGMLKVRPGILKLLKLFKLTFCQTKEEEQIFTKFSFLLWRSLYECYVMYEIDGQKGSKSSFELTEHLQQFSPTKQIVEHKLDFYKGFNFANEARIEEFETLLMNTINSKQEMNKVTGSDLKDIYKIQIGVSIYKADNYVKKKQIVQSFNVYLNAWKSMEILSKTETEQKSEAEKDYLEFRQIQIYQKIGRGLQSIKKYHDALKFFQLARAVHLQCNCYQAMIANESDSIAKAGYMEGYAEICQRYGRNQRAIQIYQELIDQFYYLPQQRLRAIQLLEKCLSQPACSHGYYINILAEKKRIVFDAQSLESFKSYLTSEEFEEIVEANQRPLDPEEQFNREREEQMLNSDSVDPSLQSQIQG